MANFRCITVRNVGFAVWLLLFLIFFLFKFSPSGVSLNEHCIKREKQTANKDRGVCVCIWQLCFSICNKNQTTNRQEMKNVHLCLSAIANNDYTEKLLHSYTYYMHLPFSLRPWKCCLRERGIHLCIYSKQTTNEKGLAQQSVCVCVSAGICFCLFMCV